MEQILNELREIDERHNQQVTALVQEVHAMALVMTKQVSMLEAHIKLTEYQSKKQDQDIDRIGEMARGNRTLIEKIMEWKEDINEKLAEEKGQSKVARILWRIFWAGCGFAGSVMLVILPFLINHYFPEQGQ